MVCCILSIFFTARTSLVVLYICRFMYVGWCNMATIQCNIITKQSKILFLLYPISNFSNSFLKIASCEFFSGICSCCNFALILNSLFPMLVPVYNTRLSMAAKAVLPSCTMPLILRTLQIYPEILSAVSWFTISVAVSRKLNCAH